MMRLQVIGGRLPSLTITDSATWNGGTSSRTFSGVAIGDAPVNQDRLVIVAVLLASSDPLTSVTVGGVAASAVVTYGLSTTRAAIYAAVVNSGTTADIVVNTTPGGPIVITMAIGVWAAYGLRSTTATDTDSGGDSLDDDGPALSVNVQSQGVVVFAGWGGAAASGWTELTENFDLTAEGASWAGASASRVAAGTLAVDPTGIDRARVMATWR